MRCKSVVRLRCRITLEQNDPRWVGAWWIGFLVLIVPTLLAAPFFFGYPSDPSTSLYFKIMYSCDV